jgi:phenylacetate-CoA ligase
MPGWKQALFQLKNLLANRSALAFYKALLREERLPLADLNKLNWSRRQAMVHYSWEHVPFYRRVWEDAGFHPDQLKREEDWQLVPRLSKQDLRLHFNELQARNIPASRTRLSTTGGSTGEPLKVLFDREVPLEAFNWRVLDWWGLKPHENAAFVFRQVRSGMHKVLNDLLWWPTRRDFLDASAMDEASMNAFAGRLDQHRPPLLQGYVGAVEEFARFLKNSGKAPTDLRAVWVTSSPLSRVQRVFMQEVFQAPVYDQYGCGEVFWIASECERQQGLHLMHGHRHVEVLDESGNIMAPGEEGDLFLTDMANKVFPIIRYANGDRGSLGTKPCSCGRSLPLLNPVKGRISDTLHLPNGLRIAGDYLTTLFDHEPGAVEAFQVLQDARGELSLRCIPGSGKGSLEIIESVRKALSGKAGQAVTVEQVTSIRHDGGKTRFIRSEYKG